MALCTKSKSEVKSKELPMICDGAIRLMLVEAGEKRDKGSNWFISVCS